MTRTRLLLPAVGFVAAGLLVHPARAQSEDDIEKREKAALAACDSRKVEQGIEALGRLWADTENATYIYNQGRCYQKNGMAADAINRFQEFLRVAKDHPVEHPELIGRAEAFVKELENELASHPAPPPPPTSPIAGQPSPSSAPPVEVVAPPAATSAAPPQAAARDWRRLLGYGTAALGGATMVTGSIVAVVSAHHANDARDRYTSAQTGDVYDRARSDFQSARTHNRVGWVLAGAGTALVAAGVAVIVTAPPREERSAMRLSPWATANAGGVGATGTW
jgi:hypothetical protein